MTVLKSINTQQTIFTFFYQLNRELSAKRQTNQLKMNICFSPWFTASDLLAEKIIYDVGAPFASIILLFSVPLFFISLSFISFHFFTIAFVAILQVKFSRKYIHRLFFWLMGDCTLFVWSFLCMYVCYLY